MEDFDLSLDLLFFDGFEDFDHALLILDDVHAFKDLAIFPAPNFAHHLVVILVAPVDLEGVVVPVLFRAVLIHIGVNASTTSESSLTTLTRTTPDRHVDGRCDMRSG